MEIFEVFEKLRELKGSKAKIAFAKKEFTSATHQVMEVCFNDEVYGISGAGISKAIGYDDSLYGKQEDFGMFVEKLIEDDSMRQFYKRFTAANRMNLYEFQLTNLVSDLLGTSGNDQIEMLKKHLNGFMPQEIPWIIRAIQKNMRIGFNLASYNKVRKAHERQEIVTQGLQLAGKSVIEFNNDGSVNMIETKKNFAWMTFPCFADIKYDGERAVPSCDKINGVWKVRILSRGFEDITHQYPEVVKQLLKVAEKLDSRSTGFMLDAEIISSSFAKLSQRMHRKAENIGEHDSDIKLVTFDILESVFEDEGKEVVVKVREKPQIYRREILDKFAAETGLITSYQITINSFEELIDFYLQQRADKQEGVIAKSFDGIWQPHSRDGWCKLVPLENLDLEIIDAYYGNGKNANKITGVVVRNKAGTIQSKATGFSNEQRDEITRLYESNDLFGRIAEIKYRELQPPKNGVSSLRFPGFVDLRKDKTESD